MSLFPCNQTPKPRALMMFLLGVAIVVGCLAGGVFLTPALFLLAYPGGGLIGWFGMEYFCGDGPG
jgi:hypothetical protein